MCFKCVDSVIFDIVIYEIKTKTVLKNKYFNAVGTLFQNN
jgi:hypothetical protein